MATPPRPSLRGIDDCMVDIDVYLGDEQSKDTSVTGPSPNDTEAIHTSTLSKRINDNRIFFALGIFVISLTCIPILLLWSGNSSLSGAASQSATSVAIVNDICLSAVTLHPGYAPLLATTSGANSDDDGAVNTCGLDLDVGPSVWFKVAGTGGFVKVSKDDEQSFTNQMSVYGGECGKLTCLTGDNLKGTALWNTEVDKTYFIRVSGVNSATGSFHIVVEGLSHVSGEWALNDFCEDAIGIATDGSLSHATTETATFDIDGAGSCYRAANAGPGVWYDVIGTGGSMIATTNSSSTLLAVFKGSCDNLECQTASDLADGVASVVQWNSNEAQRYYILAHGISGEKGAPFEISVTDSMANDAHFVINDFCKGAIGPVASDGSVIHGSLEFATLDTDGAGRCYPDILKGDGIWFSVLGTGGMLKVYPTLGSKTVDPLVSVFTGWCGKLQCAEGAYHSIDNEERKVLTWPTKENETYMMLVRSINDVKGPFELVVESESSVGGVVESDSTQAPTSALPDPSHVTQAGRPANDYCDAAQEIPHLDTIISYSTENATDHMDGVGLCHSEVNLGPGIWYRFVGNGNTLRASTTDSSDLEVFFSVYSGDCEELVCILDSNGEQGVKQSFAWSSTPETVYYILVQGPFSQTGPFEFVVKEESSTNSNNVEIDNFTCEGASELILSPDVALTSTTGKLLEAIVPTYGPCSSEGGLGPWYKVQGADAVISASVETLMDTTSVGVSVYSGPCDGLECLTSVEGAAGAARSVTWKSSSDLTYYLFVHSSPGSTGAFKLMLEQVQVKVPVNDVCAEALTLYRGASYVGSTEGATMDTNIGASCHTYSTIGPGVWYKFDGDGEILTITQFSNFTDETVISMYSGSCDNLKCSTSHNSTATQRAPISFRTTKGQKYFMLVESRSADVAEFAFTFHALTAMPTATPTRITTTPTTAFPSTLPTSGSTEAPSTAKPTAKPTRATTTPTTAFPTTAPTSGPTEAPTKATPGPTTSSTPEPTKAPYKNDLCENAIGHLTDGSRVEGAFAHATDDSAGKCGTAQNGNPGVWFTISGTGAAVRISACTNFHLGMFTAPGIDSSYTSVSVFRQGCDDLQCYIGSNNTCTEDGLIIWNTEEGEVYHILVSGDDGAMEEGYELMYDLIDWSADQCLGGSDSFTKELGVLEEFVLASDNTLAGSTGALMGRGWLKGCDICNKWKGITCNDKQEVNKIQLAGLTQHLTGSLSDVLGDLPEIILLDLSDNRMVGTIPKDIDRMQKLESLNLRGNSFSGELPKELSKLEYLSHLDLQSNLFKGAIPGDLSKLQALELFSLGNNTLTGTLPTSFGELVALRVLRLHSNKLEGAIPSELGLLTNLANLVLHDNNFSGTMPTEICQLRSSGTLTSLTAACAGNSPVVLCSSDCCTECY